MKLTFNEWMVKVDTALVRVCGLDSDCIEDFGYYDAFDEGMSPTAAAKAALANAGYDPKVKYYR